MTFRRDWPRRGAAPTAAVLAHGKTRTLERHEMISDKLTRHARGRSELRDGLGIALSQELVYASRTRGESRGLVGCLTVADQMERSEAARALDREYVRSFKDPHMEHERPPGPAQPTMELA